MALCQTLRDIGEAEPSERRIEHLSRRVEDELAVDLHLELALAFFELPSVQPSMGRKAEVDAVVGDQLPFWTSVAHAQAVETIVTPAPGPAVIAQGPVAVPPSGVLVAQPAPIVAAAPVEAVETVRTVRTTTPRTVSRHVARTRAPDRVTTTRTTTVRQGVVAEPGVAATAAYDELVQDPRYYDVVTPMPPFVAAQPVVSAAPVIGATAPLVAGTVVPLYRYVYEPDRILVIDPYTNIAVQAIPR